VYIHQTDQDRR